MANDEPQAGGDASPSFLNSIGFDRLSGHGDLLFAAGVLGILAVLLFPVPTGMLDFLLSISITFAVLILMNVLFINRSLDFNSFPTILLIAAMFRLSLNIASTRLILAEGHTGPAAAGHVIEAFGSFVMGGSVVIGVIVFAILTIINFIVITKGSGRIAEVSARFSLDAMPGKQMAIDADLSAGLIDEATAKSRRKELEDESNFFGAMDGASKFVRGDAVAGLLITFINFIGGIVIGVVQRDLTFAQASETYTILTIGDGLVSQIPALIVSTSAGLLVTKSGILGSTEKAIFSQLGRFPQSMGVTSVLLTGMAAMPALPALPFLSLAALTGGMAFYLNRVKRAEASEEETDEDRVVEQAEADAKAQEESPDKALEIDPLKLELGYGLLPLINYQKGHRLTEQIKALRKQIVKDQGFIMPSVRIQDNMQLPANTYIIKVKDIECGRGEIRPDMLLVMDPKGDKITLPGEDTIEPTFGLPAKWVAESNREEALFRNYTVVDPPTIITTHITEVIKENISELLSYSETQNLIDSLGDKHKKLVEDTIPTQISVGGIQRVLQTLLSEHVSVRDLPTILEAISEATRHTSNLTMITEHVRMRLARQLSYASADENGTIAIVTLSPQWEQAFAESLIGDGEEKQLAMQPSQLQEFIKVARTAFEQHAMRGELPILLTSSAIRPYVRAVIERFRPALVVMGQNEVHSKIKLRNLGQV
jgi:flagellar biosynthesis protein FlhA